MVAVATLAAPLTRLLLPDWLVAWFAIAAVVTVILGFRRAALVLGTIPVTRWLVMPILATVMPPLPNWLPLAAGAVLGVAMVLSGMRRSARLRTGPPAPHAKGRIRP